MNLFIKTENRIDSALLSKNRRKTDLNMRMLKALSIMQWRPLHQSRQNPQIPTCMLSNNLLAPMWLIIRGSPALNDKPQGSTNSPWPLCLYFNEKSLKTVTTRHHLLGGIYLSSVLTLEGTPATWRFTRFAPCRHLVVTLVRVETAFFKTIVLLLKVHYSFPFQLMVVGRAVAYGGNMPFSRYITSNWKEKPEFSPPPYDSISGYTSN